MSKLNVDNLKKGIAHVLERHTCFLQPFSYRFNVLRGPDPGGEQGEAAEIPRDRGAGMLMGPFWRLGRQVELQIGLKDYDTQRDKRFAGTIKLPHVPRPRLKAFLLSF